MWAGFAALHQWRRARLAQAGHALCDGHPDLTAANHPDDRPSPHRRQPDPPDLAAPSTVRALLVWLVTNVTRALAAVVTPW